MVNFVEEIEKLIKGDEKVFSKVVVQRKGLVKNASICIYLTNKRLIYWKCGLGGKGFDFIPLSEINSISFIPRLIASSGIIRVTKSDGKVIKITPSDLSNIEANDFVKEVNKRIK